MKRLRCLSLIVLVVLLPLTVGAEMYQWVDDKGIQHYANTPPPEGTRAAGSWSEIRHEDKSDQAREAQEAVIIKEVDAANRQAEVDKAAEKQRQTRQAAIDAKKAEKEKLGESIGNKRRYIKRRGKTDINKIKRLNAEIEALKDDKKADPEKIRALEKERDETKENFYRKSGRARKGTRQEIQDYRRLDKEIQEEKSQ